MPLPLEEESDSEPELEALPAEQNNITHLSSRQVSELIISSGSEGRHTSRDQRITEEFESVIRIVSSRPRKFILIKSPTTSYISGSWALKDSGRPSRRPSAATSRSSSRSPRSIEPSF